VEEDHEEGKCLCDDQADLEWFGTLIH
jgi:hypothetical protein